MAAPERPALGETAAAHQPTMHERDLSGHIFSVSAGLVGVCLTVVGLFKIFQREGTAVSMADNLVAIDALVFLLAAFFAYLALRATHEGFWRVMQRWADALFLLGIVSMVFICGLIAYEVV